MRVIAVVLLLMFFLSGCSTYSSDALPDDEALAASASSSSHLTDINVFKSEYNVYVSKKMELSLYEPASNCYLGAYVLSNRNIDFDMKKFDGLTEKKHFSYIYNIKLGEPFPVQWVLECISLMKTPYIIIHPQNSYNPFDVSLLEQVAKEFGEFYTPMFVAFYPNPSSYNVPPDEYIDFFKKARDVFSTFASNAAFVWNVDSKDVYISSNFYPGDFYIDWIGINIYEPIYENGVRYQSNFWKDLNFFYLLYQDKKPLMISQLAISHYSSKDHIYYNKEASNQITEIYETVKNDYPRIKSINYMDFSNINLSPIDTVRDDFSVTNDDIILNAYRSAIEDDYFLEDIHIMQTGELSDQLLKSAYDVYEDTKNIFVSEKLLDYELEYVSKYKLKNKEVIINNELYYTLNDLEELENINIIIDKPNNKIYINHPV